MSNVVVATGGGSVLSEANRAAMRRRGFIVVLRCAAGDDCRAHPGLDGARVGAAAAGRRQSAGEDHRVEGGARPDLRAGRLHHPDGRPDAGPGDAPGAAGVPRTLGGRRGQPRDPRHRGASFVRHPLPLGRAGRSGRDDARRRAARLGVCDLGRCRRPAVRRARAGVAARGGLRRVDVHVSGRRSEQEPRDGAIGLRLAARTARRAIVDGRRAGRRRRRATSAASSRRRTCAA